MKSGMWEVLGLASAAAPGRMQGLLGSSVFDIDDDHHAHHAFQRRLLCAGPDDQADRRLRHFLRHTGHESAAPMRLPAPIHRCRPERQLSLRRHVSNGIYLYTLDRAAP